MKQFVLTFLLAVLLAGLCSGPARAEGDYYFKTLNVQSGLSQNTVNAILQDRQGYMWFGTKDGLNRYDGSRFRIFKHSPEEGGLSSNFITALCEDRDGNIWIGTYFGGVNYYSPSFASFEKYYPEDGRDDLLGKRVREIREDARGVLWIGTEDGGLHRFQPDTRSFSQLRPWQDFNNVHGLCLIGDDLWVGTISRGLRIIDTRTGAIRKRYENSEGHRILNDNNIYAVYCTKARDIFLGSQYGLMKYNPEDDTFHDIPDLQGKHVYDIGEDVHGNLWVGTYSEGAWRFDISVRIVAPNYSSPQAKPIEYMLEGYDNLWQSDGDSPVASYSNLPPGHYTLLARLKKAALLFRQDFVRVNEACYLVGFNSPSYFSKCFQKQFGISPKDFLEKSLQEAGRKH